MKYFIAGFIATFCSLIVIDNQLHQERKKEKNDA